MAILLSASSQRPLPRSSGVSGTMGALLRRAKQALGSRAVQQALTAAAPNEGGRRSSRAPMVTTMGLPERRSARATAAQEGVSDVVGSILLVGITVLMTSALAIMILAFQGPPKTLHATLSVTVEPGAAGWNSQDETIVVKHLGGDRLGRGLTAVTYRVNNGATTTLKGNALTGAFSDGYLSTGETWTYPVPLAATDSVVVNVVDTHGRGSSLLVGGTIVPGNLGSGPACVLDGNPPTAQQWTQNPTDVRTTTTASTVVVTITAADDCYGVKTSVTPQLWWCINGGTCTYAQAPTMTLVSGTTWQGTIPLQTWAVLGGKTLQYQVRQLTDNGNNAGTVQGVDDIVDVITQYKYIDCPVTITTGSVGTCANMQDATPTSTTVLTEGSSGTVAQALTTFLGNANTGSVSIAQGTSCVAAAPESCALTQNTQYARLDLTTDLLKVTGFQLPANAVGVNQVVLGMVGKRVDSNNPTARITYSGPGTDPSPASLVISALTDTVFETDVTADRTWTPANVNSLVLTIDATNGAATRRLDVDVVYIKVIYTIPSYAMNIQGAFSNVPLGSTYTLGIQYQAAGDTYSLQVCQDALPSCATWTTRVTLSSTTMVPIVYTMTTTEYNNGAPRVRFLDVTSTNTTPGTLTIDYLRVATT
jgi:hypothetical protein